RYQRLPPRIVNDCPHAGSVAGRQHGSGSSYKGRAEQALRLQLTHGGAACSTRRRRVKRAGIRGGDSMKIAVLDDDPVQLAAITAVAQDAGYRPTGFSRSGALLSALRRDTFDLMVLDWNLPDRSGIEVIGWVRLNVDPPP